MRHRPLFLAAVLLFFGMPELPVLRITALNAQGAPSGLRPGPAAAASLMGTQPSLVQVPDSARRYPQTYWKSGLLIGGILGGALGMALGSALCGLSDVSTQDCTGAALGGALMLGTSAGAVGALVGGLFPKPPKQPAPESPR